jgi:hypothetical protein
MPRDYKTCLENILQNKLPTLATQIKRILESLDSPPQDTSGR